MTWAQALIYLRIKGPLISLNLAMSITSSF